MPPLGQWLRSFGIPSILSIVATYGVIRFVFQRELRGSIDCDSEIPALNGNGKLVLLDSLSWCSCF